MSAAVKDSRASPVIDDMAVNQTRPSKSDSVLRKSMCRYGPGCTHIMDPSHKEKFWHPRVLKLNDEQIKSHFICNECGYATNSLPDLQLHLQRKTAWSNQSLVGCRINCLVDMKEWHEGHVTQFHKSGKHFVEFRLLQERRWLLMKKVTFYIIERPSVVTEGGEFKDSGDHEASLAPIEDSWVYCEDISMDYAFAQSVLFKIYGNSLQETGHLTRGHVCVTETDRLQAQQAKSSLLYGELLPRGANKALGAKRLDAESAETLFDLGMGTGKILLQAFLQFRNLRYIYGVELSAGRYQLAEEAALRMVELLGNENYHVHMSPGKFIMVTEAVRLASSSDEHVLSGREEEEYVERVLHFQCGNMFDLKEIDLADIVMMETDIPTDLYPNLQNLLGQMKEQARVLTYFDLRRIFDCGQLPFQQLEANKNLSDRYPTSWSVQRGHHFYIWTKQSLPEPAALSPWSFSSMVSTDPSNDPSAPQGNQANAPQVLQSRIGSPVVGSASPHSPGKGASSPDHLPQSSGSRCCPFGFRFLFGSSSKKQNTTSSSQPSRPSLSIPDSPSAVDRSSPSRGQKPNRNPTTLDSPTPTPTNKKNGMRFVGDDADSRDRSVPTSSPPKLKFTSNYRTVNGDASTNDGGNDLNWSSSAQQSPRSSPRDSAITDSNDTPVVCTPSDGTVSASAKMSSSKSSKRSGDRSRKSKRSESPRLKRASSGKHQSGTPSTAAAPIDEQPTSPTGCFVTASSSSSVVIDQQPPDLLLPFPSLTLATTAAFITPNGPDSSGLPNDNTESPRMDNDIAGSSSSRNGMEFSPDIRSRMRASPLQSDLHSSSIISNGSNS